MSKKNTTMSMADFFADTIEVSKKRFGKDAVLVGTNDDENQYGPQLMSLAQMYVYKANILPLGNILGIAGATMSRKSAYGFDLCRFILSIGGAAHLIEHENKFNKQFMHSILGKGAISIVPASTVEDAQASLVEVLTKYKEKARNAFPYIIGIDSLAGSGTKNSNDSINKSGYASKSYPEAANLWSSFFKTVSSDLIDLNVLVYFTNHLKKKIDTMGFGTQYTKQGGTAPDFHAGQYMYFTPVGKIKSVAKPGEFIQIKTHKCGTGPAGHNLVVPIIDTIQIDPDTGEPIQSIYWDWDAATAKLLVSDKLSTTIKNSFDITCNSNKYSSKEVGVTQVTDSELGRAIHSNPELFDEFRKRLHIHRFPIELKKSY